MDGLMLSQNTNTQYRLFIYHDLLELREGLLSGPEGLSEPISLIEDTTGGVGVTRSITTETRVDNGREKCQE
jgi:hypothetical protein